MMEISPWESLKKKIHGSLSRFLKMYDVCEQ